MKITCRHVFWCIISPSFCFFDPQFQIQCNSYKSHPVILSLWYDCPHHLSHTAQDYLENTLGCLWPDEDLPGFCQEIDWFISQYYKTITPWSALKISTPIPLPFHTMWHNPLETSKYQAVQPWHSQPTLQPPTTALGWPSDFQGHSAPCAPRP